MVLEFHTWWFEKQIFATAVNQWASKQSNQSWRTYQGEMRFIIIIITSKSVIITSKRLTGFYDTRYLMFAEAENLEEKKKKKKKKGKKKQMNPGSRN